jgi:hypothetical protein
VSIREIRGQDKTRITRKGKNGQKNDPQNGENSDFTDAKINRAINKSIKMPMSSA